MRSARGCRVVRLQVTDEARIADLFKSLVDGFPDVSAGSYPDVNTVSGSFVSISLEAKDESQVIAAVHRLKMLLDEHPDSELSQACITQIDVDVETLLMAEKKSVQ
jgi:molybdopterin-biosynthesis enzyme MoeA-like protein